uniref:Protein kinase domain-containing protein n=1 Tax=Oryza punctata TaxID=4537 RepID=A0A0E0K1R0_ORYPU
MVQALKPWRILAATLLIGTIKATMASRMAKPGCQETCGNITIPYPFGIGAGCFYSQGFDVSCEDDRTYMHNSSNKMEIYSLNMLGGQARVSTFVANKCSNTDGTWTNGWAWAETARFFTLSSRANKLTAVGCNTLAFLLGYNKNKQNVGAGCFSMCRDKQSTDSSGQCSGMGCCQTSIAPKLSSFNVTFDSGFDNSEVNTFNPCSYAFVAEQDWFRFEPAYLEGHKFTDKYKGVPAVLDWVAGNESCAEAPKNRQSYACVSSNSHCINSPNATGYLCACNDGFAGNPYLEGGCQDINECEFPGQSCHGICDNTIGGYNCYCRPGTQSTDPKREPCNPKTASERARLTKTFIVDTVRIFTKEELENATDNFDSSRELGRGGHGTVYKGILKDNRIVAIKRSKIMNMVQKDEFVQEMIILSQINHRNVVRLLGCCLEVEVPMLVYEFIPNGTLFELIHGKYRTTPISLDARLRFAQESAEALAYLHSSASPPIVHGDVKSPNILLGDNYITKVTDFGASRMLPKDEIQFMTMVQGTLGYLDPEYLQERQLTEKSDVYSSGVVLLELITGKTAIYSENTEEKKSLASSFLLALKKNRLQSILDRNILGVGTELFQDVAQLAKCCLSTKGEERPLMTEVAERLKAIRSTWREQLIEGGNEETVCLLENSSQYDPSTTGRHESLMTLDLETGR